MDAGPPASVKAAPWLIILCVAVAAAGAIWPAWDMFGPQHRPMVQGWDDSFYYFWLPSVVIDRDLDFTNQLAHCGTMDAAAREAGLAQPRTATGLLPNKYPLGWALASLPFFLAAHVFAPAGTTGFEPGYLLAVWTGQLLYAAAGLWLAVRLVRRLIPAAPATTAVLSVWLASPLVYYQSARLSMPHSLVFTLAVAVFWLAQRLADGDTRSRVWAALGFCGALLVVTRNVAIVYLAIPAVLAGPKLRSIKSAAWLALGAAGPVAIQLVAWKILFGSWLVYSYGGERFDFLHPHLLAVLFSPRHGWFYWHPLLLMGIAAFCTRAWRRRDGQAALVSLGAITVLNAAWPVWWLGSSFGHRGFEAATFFAMLGLAVLWPAARSASWPRRLVASAVVLAVTWNLLLGALFLTQRISRGDAVTYAQAGRALAAWIRGPE